MGAAECPTYAADGRSLAAIRGAVCYGTLMTSATSPKCYPRERTTTSFGPRRVNVATANLEVINNRRVPQDADDVCSFRFVGLVAEADYQNPAFPRSLDPDYDPKRRARATGHPVDLFP